ncbi:MAG: helix-turn-helix transcriptional regulator [Bdellovibrionales bacterium]|nr:helix-turn-helix transcriptional regulator [Bdellovibrionales bacterium]
MSDQLTVRAENYVTHFQFLAKDLIQFNRIHRFDQSVTEVDSLPGVWSLAIGDLHPGLVKVPTENGLIDLRGPVAVFIPPFSPVQWLIEPCILEFKAFISPTPLPPGIPHKPFYFAWPNHCLPKSVSEVFAVIKDLKSFTYIRPPGRYSVPAQMTKNFIDSNYHRRLSLAEMAKKLKYSHSFLTRSFKSTYGLSPVDYRTKLRLFDAQMLLLTKPSNVTSIAYASGFSDPGRFMKQFRRLFKARPSQFRQKDSLRDREINN